MFENRKLIESFKKLSKWRPLLNYQWHIIPLLNPDGYWKSHEVDTHGKRKINSSLEVYGLLLSNENQFNCKLIQSINNILVNFQKYLECREKI